MYYFTTQLTSGHFKCVIDRALARRLNISALQETKHLLLLPCPEGRLICAAKALSISELLGIKSQIL